MKAIILVSVLCFASVFGVEWDHPCREEFPAKLNFNSAFYTGTWYELYSSMAMRTGAECVDHHYTRREFNLFDVDKTSVIDDEYVFESAQLSLIDPHERPVQAIFNGTVFGQDDAEDLEYNFRIYATDYTNYALLWSCVDLPDGRSREEGSILGRTITLLPSVYAKIDLLLEGVGLNRTDYREIRHDREACLLETNPDPED